MKVQNLYFFLKNLQFGKSQTSNLRLRRGELHICKYKKEINCSQNKLIKRVFNWAKRKTPEKPHCIGRLPEKLGHVDQNCHLETTVNFTYNFAKHSTFFLVKKWLCLRHVHAFKRS